MFNEINNLSENVMLSERIKGLMIVLETNYFEKSEYDFDNYVEARECCINYKDILTLVETIYDLVMENNEKLNKNMDILMEKERENRKANKEVA